MSTYYLTLSFAENFQANTAPSFRCQVNGMSTKTNAVKHALGCEVLSDIKQLENLDIGDIFIEPLFFKEQTDAEFEACTDILKDWQARKVLLCSEMEPLRWVGEKASRIVETVDAVYASCWFQKNLMDVIDINAADVVYEPVNEHLFFPGVKQDWVVAIGSPTQVKNVDALIKIFSGLEGTGLKRIYIGGPIVWGKITGMKNESAFDYIMKKHEALKAVSDVYYPPSPQTRIAYVLSQAKYYLNFAYHETCCRTAMEAMLSGVGILAGKHPLFREYPCVASGLSPDECIEQLKTLPEVSVEQTRQWALENVSYSAFHRNVVQTP